jgi:hypothetical protein
MIKLYQLGEKVKEALSARGNSQRNPLCKDEGSRRPSRLVGRVRKTFSSRWKDEGNSLR